MKARSAHDANGRRHFLRLGSAATVAIVAGGLAACGGSDDEEPTVTLASTVTSAAAGASITLIAVPSSDSGISGVRFYRVDSTTSTLLATVNTSPYQITTAIPSDASGTVSYFARAVDTNNLTGDSNSVSITITS